MMAGGAAERGVRWFKTMARVLMSEAKASSIGRYKCSRQPTDGSTNDWIVKA